MTPRRTKATRGLLFAALLPCLGALASVPKPAPTEPPSRETLKWGDTELMVERTATATAADLQLPFHAGAKLHEGHTYRVTAKDGKELNFLASATLTTGEKAEKVAERYSQLLPGKPKPETIQDKSGKRLVLAIASKEEVRTVTLLPKPWGCRILLVRAVTRDSAPPLPKPRIVSPPQMGPRRGPGDRGGGRRGPARRGGTRV